MDGEHEEVDRPLNRAQNFVKFPPFCFAPCTAGASDDDDHGAISLTCSLAYLPQPSNDQAPIPSAVAPKPLASCDLYIQLPNLVECSMINKYIYTAAAQNAELKTNLNAFRLFVFLFVCRYQ